MNTNSTGAKKQPKLRLVPDTGRDLGYRGSASELLLAFDRMDDRAAREICRMAAWRAEAHPRAACGDLRLAAGGQA